MEHTTTKIAELPLSTDIGNNNKSMLEQPNNYIPINVHPNPYGGSGVSDVMSPPMNQDSNQQNQLHETVEIRPKPPQTQYLSEEQMLELQTLSHQQLPSRDIPMNPSDITQDEQATPNYIQKKVHFDDYVKEHSDFSKEQFDTHERGKEDARFWYTLLGELQVPIFVGVIYFIFQMPVLNQYLFKKLSFLSIYNEDGNFNFYGLLLKSMMFSIIYFTCIQAINYVLIL